MFDYIAALLAPHRCAQCTREGTLWCVACRADAPRIPERCYRCYRLMSGGRTCPRCRRTSSLFSVTAATSYTGAAKTLIWRLKFDGARAAAAVAAACILERCALPKDAIIVPVPTATGRVRRRGYDQAVLLADQLARRTSLPSAHLLRRLGQTQQRTATQRQRIEQLQGSFQITSVAQVSDAHILLIDDVLTTGATVNAAAIALRAAGARRVSGVVFAQA